MPSLMTTTNLILASGQNVDFMIHGLIDFELFGQTLWITTTHVSMLLVMLVLIVVACIIRANLKAPDEKPGLLQSFAEIGIEMLHNMVEGIMGSNAPKYMNYIGTIFLFILLSNISGIFGLRPPTADFGVTLPMGLMTFAIVQYNNIRNNKFGAFTALFEPVPFLFPINLIGEIATPFSLGLRLFGNIISGTVIVALFYGMVPILFKIGVPAALHVYFVLRLYSGICILYAEYGIH